MRTEDDLRHAVDVPADDDAIARLTEFATGLDHGAPRVRRQWVLPLAAAALVAVLVAGVGLLFAGGRDGGSPPAGGSGPVSAEELRPTWAMTFAPVGGYTVRNVIADVGGLQGTLASVRATRTDRPEQGSITSTPCTTAEPCGKFPTTTPTPVTVGGERGSFWPGGHIEPGELVDSVYKKPWQAANESNEQQPQLVWQTGGTTLLVTGTFGFDPTTYDYDDAQSKAIMLRLARAVTAGRHDDITMPLALGRLPDHVAPESVQIHDGFACIGYGTGEGPYPGDWTGSVLTACRVTTGRDDDATLKTARIEKGETGGTVVRDLPDGTSVVLALDSRHSDLLTADQLQRLAARADVTPKVADPDTWLVVR